MEKITIYTVEECNKCEILKQKLTQKNMEFEVVSSVGKLIKLGFKSPPVLEVVTDGEIERMDYDKGLIWILQQRRNK